MKLFTTKQIAELDNFTILNEPISDLDLMERASLQISNWMIKNISTEQRMIFFAGPGNNGGDAMAVARQLSELDYHCEVCLFHTERGLRGSPETNWKRLEEGGRVKLSILKEPEDFPAVNPGDTLIDGLFGSGLSRPLEGFPADIVRRVNKLSNTVVSIDIPSGLMGEDNSLAVPGNIIRADFTLTLQFPKISFMFSENEKYTGKIEVLPIGLHPEGIERAKSDFFLTGIDEVRSIYPKLSKFEHKGTMGHALLIAGSYGKMGASVLASKGCLRSGVGLLTAHVPHYGYSIVQTAVPEAMTSIDQHDSMFTEYPDLSPYTAVGIGPGIGQKQNSCRALSALLEEIRVPIVLDADALNILASKKELLDKLPENSVLTPHPGEFRRLAGETENSYKRLERQIQFSKKYKVIVVLKGAFTAISTPEGKVFFNSSGNPGMATAGSGDTLTGIILAFLARGFSPVDAAVCGVYIHGLAGDLAARQVSHEALIAGDIVRCLGKAFLKIKSDPTK